MPSCARIVAGPSGRSASTRRTRWSGGAADPRATASPEEMTTNQPKEAEMPKHQKFILTLVLVSAPLAAAITEIPVAAMNHNETLLLDA